MPREKLKETLQSLADQLAAADDIATGTAEDIREAIGEIREALDGDDTETPWDALRRRMTDAATDFEDTHPTVASTLGQIGDLLARVGI